MQKSRRCESVAPRPREDVAHRVCGHEFAPDAGNGTAYVYTQSGPGYKPQAQLNASNAAAGGSTAALEAALDIGTPVKQADTPLPLALGFVGAVPITWLQRRARIRLRDRRRNRHGHR